MFDVVYWIGYIDCSRKKYSLYINSIGADYRHESFFSYVSIFTFFYEVSSTNIIKLGCTKYTRKFFTCSNI